jgi:hypothetical protein
LKFEFGTQIENRKEKKENKKKKEKGNYSPLG